MTISWLHLSDVHECEAEGYHRRAMYNQIIAEVDRNPIKPDFVFFTGDLSFSGTTKEYDLLRERLIEPLRKVLPPHCRFFSIPGNHDVDRKRVVRPRLWMTNAEERDAFQQVGSKGRQKRADALLPRFEAYRAFERDYAAWDSDWLASEQGSICKIEKVGGCRIAVVGINTAWLCQDDDDWGRLTAGRTMVDAALQQAAMDKPDIVIVLGHHPLAALTGEQSWSDGDRIRLRLEQANAVYLHGHLHASGNQRAGETARSVLAIQAPSAFQAGDSKIWRNGVLWGEADLDRGTLAITPKRWNDDHNEYAFDSDAFASSHRKPGADRFVFPLPGRAANMATPRSAPEAGKISMPEVPEGWEIVDGEALRQKIAKPPSPKEMSDWFDGRFSRWEVILAEGIQPRHIVTEVVRRFEAARDGASRPQIVLISGAGGEGKTAALLQIAAGLVQGGRSWTCLWRRATAATVPDDIFDTLPSQPGHSWIVAIDDAENAARPLKQALESARSRTDIHAVLAARDADWSIRGLTEAMWRDVAAFKQITIDPLDAEDARRIAEGWAAYGDDAAGRLAGRNVEDVAQTLLHHAKEQAARREEGSLLGALLIAREGVDLKDKVVGLMQPWKEQGFGKKSSYLDLYAAIAAMHAENQLYLSPSVLALALQCEESDLDQPLRILRREALVDSGTTYLLTRHRRIAEVARDWLVEEGYDIGRWYSDLARAGRRHFLDRRPAPPHDARNWTYELARHFVDKWKEVGDRRYQSYAVAVARAVYEAEADNLQLLTAYAATLRRTARAGEAQQLILREVQERLKRRRSQSEVTERALLYEWSVAAGLSDNHGLSSWLAGRSLADDQSALDANRCKLSLAGLATAFKILKEENDKGSFAKAWTACGRLGLRLRDVDAETRRIFDEASAAAPQGEKATLQQDIESVKKATISACDEVLDNAVFFERLLGHPSTYKFAKLHDVLSNSP